MCNIFSGHIIIDEKEKDWGKILFISGIHHEEDRKVIYKKYGKDIQLIAWESKVEYSLKEFIFPHSCGKRLTNKEKDTYMDLLIKWASKQDATQLRIDVDKREAKNREEDEKKQRIEDKKAEEALKKALLSPDNKAIILDKVMYDNFIFPTFEKLHAIFDKHEKIEVSYTTFNKLKDSIDVDFYIEKPKEIVNCKDTQLQYAILIALSFRYAATKLKYIGTMSGVAANLEKFKHPELCILLLILMTRHGSQFVFSNLIKQPAWARLNIVFKTYLMNK